MSDLYLDPLTGDVHISPTKQARLTGTFEEEATQRLRMRLRRLAGEWFLDTNLGVPYRRDILVKNPDLQVVKSALQKEILADPAVESVTEFSLDHDRESRHLDVTFTAVLTSAVAIEVALLLTPLLTDAGQIVTDDDGSNLVPFP
jgi:hypothetical protein